MDPRKRASEFEGFHREMEKFLEEAGGWGRPGGFFIDRIWRPRFNLYESEDQIVILVDLAGMKKDDLDIRVDTRVIYLRGERDEPIPPATKRCHRLEIPTGPFEREIVLPAAVEPSRVTVHYEDGWLHLRMPKAERIRVQIEGPSGEEG